MRSRFLALVICVLACTSGCKDWVDINNADRDKIVGALDDNVNKLKTTVDGLQATLEEQRTKLAGDLQQTVAMTVTNMRSVIDQLNTSIERMQVSMTNFQEVLTADVTGGIGNLGAIVGDLKSAVANQSADTIRRLARTVEEQRIALIRQTEQAVQAVIRPTLERLSRDGNYLVGKIELGVNVIIVRIVSGIIAMIALIGLVIVLVKLKDPGRRWPAVGITAVVLLCGLLSTTVLAAPISKLGAKEEHIKSGAAVCTEAFDLYQRLKTEPSPSRELASQVCEQAVECTVVAPTALLADLADGAYRDARRIAWPDSPNLCTTHAQCASGMKCDVLIGECIDSALYCDDEIRCASGHKCVSHRCGPGIQPCSAAADCGSDQACNVAARECIDKSTFTASACDVVGRSGPCAQGQTAIEAGLVVCKQTTAATTEACDGIDNDCNGTIDDGIQRAEHCIAEGAQGECRSQGNWSCSGAGGWVCKPGTPQGETTFACDGKDNDCDGRIDNDVPQGQACTNSGALGECGAHATLACVAGAQRCVPANPSPEVCDGLDNDCDGRTDPMGTCPEVVIRQQSDSDFNKEMTWSPKLPTDLIDGHRDHFGPCGTDEHGRPYTRTRAEVHAFTGHGASCELVGPYDGFLNPDPHDCTIRVHYKTTKWGSNVWCNGTWWGVATGPFQ